MNDGNALPNLAHIPQCLRQQVEHYWSDFQKTLCTNQISLKRHKKYLKGLTTLWALSDYAAKICTQHPHLLHDLLAQGSIQKAYQPYEYDRKLAQHIEHCQDEKSLSEQLRLFRHREMLRLIWRDLVELVPQPSIMTDLTLLAEACVKHAYLKCHAWQQQYYGIPRDKQGNPQELLILALGKLGAQELNLSSDIDLIFVYPKDGSTDGKRSLSNEAYFSKIAQQLLKLLNEMTALGFVFRVDLRLRPYGESGPLVMDLNAIETYYQAQGRTWERYALLRARLIVGGGPPAKQLLKIINQFVYRRYVDYSVINSLRDMKLLISRSSRSNELQQDIKRGPGGIRELEFIVQVFQLIRGGQIRALQCHPLLKVLPQLAKSKTLSKDIVTTLTSAYLFLRKLEHRLQAVSDRQTHCLPTNDSMAQTRLAFSMGMSDWKTLLQEVTKYQQQIQVHFSKTIATPKYDHVYRGLQEEFKAIWLKTINSNECASILQQHGYRNPETTLSLLAALRDSKSCALLRDTARQRLDSVMPLLIAFATRTADPNLTLTRTIKVIEAILRRSVYLSLLLENPKALEQLVTLCAVSNWLTDHIAKYPLLLDELLQSQQLYQNLETTELQNELQQELIGFSIDDIEEQMAMLCRFKHTQVLRTASADIMQILPLTAVSDHLSDVAITIIKQVCNIAWFHLGAKYGYPSSASQLSAENNNRFAIIAYGKLGSSELSYSSDLDLVFLYEEVEDMTETNGPNAISVSVFYARLAQRIVHLLNTHTASGVLYHVDTRLRPSGDAGLIVTPFEGFAEYQRTKAWTWEHQALVRARCIYGSQRSHDHFYKLRKQILCMPRDHKKLRSDIVAMRQKMLASTSSQEFDIKQSSGGLIDIEFIVQYCVLCHAHDHWETLNHTDNLHLLANLVQTHLLSNMDANILIDAYRYYRKRSHSLMLSNNDNNEVTEECLIHRQGVLSVWRKLNLES